MSPSPWLLVPAAILLLLLVFQLRGRTRSGQQKKLSSLYFKGLNYLLNEQPDKAIDTFIQVLKADAETVELHLALGNLYRRKGNIERATRIHQSLIVRSDLDRSQRANALYELGQDYYKAGLLDRAENLFIEFINLEPKHTQALKLLISIYEQEKEWSKAAGIAEKLVNTGHGEFNKNLSHYYCELAQNKIDSHLGKTAVPFLKKALAADKKCVRAYDLLAREAVQRDSIKNAQKHWKKIHKLNPAYFDEIVGHIVDVYSDKDMTSTLDRFIQRLQQNPPGLNAVLAVADWHHNKGQTEQAEDIKLRWLKAHPGSTTIAAMTRQHDLDLQNKRGESLNGALLSLLEEFSEYRCVQCGYQCNIHYWQCPGCHQWNTIQRRN